MLFGFGWHSHAQLGGLSASPLAIGAKSPVGNCGSRCPLTIANARAVSVIFGEPMRRFSPLRVITRSAKKRGKRPMANASTTPYDNAAPIWSVERCPSGKISTGIRFACACASIMTTVNSPVLAHLHQFRLSHYPFEESYEGQLRQLVGHRKLILPGVRAVIRDEERRILLVRRSDNGEWVMPAGAVELDESPIDALAREVQEETGLRVLDASLMAVDSYSGANAFGNMAHRISFVFLVDRWSGILQRKTDETLDAKFFLENELPDIPDLYRETIEDVQNFCGTVLVKEHRSFS